MGFAYKQLQRLANRFGYSLLRNNDYLDYGQNAYWYPEDGPLIDQEIWDIKMAKKGRIMDKEKGGILSPLSFFDKLQRCYDDHHNVYFNRSGKEFAPTRVSQRKYDMVTNDGIYHLAQLGTGEIIGDYFNTYAVGTGNAGELPNDSALEAESYQVSLITEGFAVAAGDSMVYTGRFPPQAPSATLYETGVFNRQQATATKPRIMLFRTVFDDDSKIVHKELEGTYTTSQTVKFIALPTIR